MLFRIFTVQLACAVILPQFATAQTFTRVTSGQVVSDGGTSFGHSWGDFDGDDYPDLVVNNIVSGQENYFYTNNGDGTFSRFFPVSANGPSTSSTWGDYNQDGIVDLFIANGGTGGSATNFLFTQSEQHDLSSVMSGNLVTTSSSFTASSWVDGDNDGDLDLFVGRSSASNIYYENLGNGLFSESNFPDGGGTWGVSFADFDEDGDMDFYAANWGIKNYFYRNDGGSFSRIGGSIEGTSEMSVSASWGDIDNDLDLDLFVANVGARNRLYRNDGGGVMTEILTGDIVTDVENSESSCWADVDNDADLDLVLSGGGNVSTGRINIFINDGSGIFSKMTQGEIVNRSGRYEGLTCVDVENDGDLDVFVSNFSNRDNELYLNDGNANNWILIDLVGVQSNTTGLGARAKILATVNGESYWQLREMTGATGHVAQGNSRFHYGIGDATQVDSLVVEWPLGQIDRFSRIDPNSFLRITEGDGLELVVTSLEGDVNPPSGKMEVYPTRVSTHATVAYETRQTGDVQIKVYDSIGRLMSQISRFQKPPGNYEEIIAVDGSSSGSYFVRVCTSTGTTTKYFAVVADGR